MVAKENWNRSYAIELGTPDRTISSYTIIESVPVTLRRPPTKEETDGTTVPSDALRLSNLESDGNSIRGFTFELDSIRGMAQSNSKGEQTVLKLYNLDQDVIRVIQQEGAMVRVLAGYGGDTTLAYSGDITSVSIDDNGSDVIYIIRCKDGVNDEKNTKVSITYADGMTDGDILVDLIQRYPHSALGVSDLADLSDRVELGGRTFVGNLVTELDKHMSQWGLQYSRFNGKFVIYPYKLDSEKLTSKSYEITADLIKSLKPTNNNGSVPAAEKTKSVSGVTLNTFYIPIEVGQVFTISKDVSEEYSGSYLVQRIRTRLQSYGSSWDVALTGVKI